MAKRVVIFVNLVLVSVVIAQEGIEPTDRYLGLVDLTQFKNCINPPPECPNSNVTFYLYTREMKEEPQLLDIAHPESLKTAKFVPDQPVKLIIHGYTGSKDYSPNTEIRPVYLKQANLNVISVDYSPLVKEPCYIAAAYNVPLVGNCTAQLIDQLVKYKIIPLESFHVIGFSLGGQVAGHINNFLKSGQLERVTGLDPAMPLFMGPFKENKLDAGDAKFVDVIHTNAGRKGKVEPSGDVDFYVNGGTHQPGCNEPAVDSPNSCSHVRAPKYFAESIYTQCGFWGSLCTNYLAYLLGWCRNWGPAEMEIMGEYINISTRGIYFVETNRKEPFARGNPEGPQDCSAVNAIPSSPSANIY